MTDEKALAVFEEFKIRRVYDDKAEVWYFSMVDIIAALLQQPNCYRPSSDRIKCRFFTKLPSKIFQGQNNDSAVNIGAAKVPSYETEGFVQFVRVAPLVLNALRFDDSDANSGEGCRPSPCLFALCLRPSQCLPCDPSAAIW